MPFAEYAVFIGSFGVGLLLLAFLFNIISIAGRDSYGYLVSNFAGAMIAGYASLLIDYIPFVVLEFFWAAIALLGIIRKIKKRGAEPP